VADDVRGSDSGGAADLAQLPRLRVATIPPGISGDRIEHSAAERSKRMTWDGVPGRETVVFAGSALSGTHFLLRGGLVGH
jgi:hypothetical protein